MSATNESSPGLDHYLSLWNKNIAEGLARIAGANVSVEPVEASGPPEDPAGLWIRLFAGKAGEQAFFVAGQDAIRLAKLLLGGAGEPDALNQECREAVTQFFEQITTMLPVAEVLGFDGELAVSEAEKPAWASAKVASFRFVSGENTLLSLRALVSEDFLSALESARKVPEAPPVSEETTAGQAPAQAGKRARPSDDPRDVNLDLLMDVELDVTLRFGQREMLLGDILKLAAGSVVELDQEVKDPVELLVGNKVIAWGEVVTVDGSYGLRVTGLASREERLESLRK